MKSMQAFVARLFSPTGRLIVTILAVTALLTSLISYAIAQGSASTSSDWLQGWLQNVSTEIIGGVLTYLLFDQVIGNIQRRRDQELARQTLLNRMLNVNSTEAMHAIVDEMVKADMPGLLTRHDIESSSTFLADAEVMWVLSPSAYRLINDIPADFFSSKTQASFLFSTLPDAAELDGLFPTDDFHQRSIEKQQQRQQTITTLNAHAEQGADVDWRVLPDHPGFYLIAKNPHRADGVIRVEFVGKYDASTYERFLVDISAAESKYVFNYWRDVFVRLWGEASNQDASS